MIRSPRECIARIGREAEGPALEMLRDWKNHEATHLNSALHVLGPMALKGEVELLKEIAARQSHDIATLKRKADQLRPLIATEESTNGGYSKSALAVSQLSTRAHEHVELLRDVLSRLDASERKFVLANIRPFLSDPQALSWIVPQAFIRSDAIWVAAQLQKEIRQHLDRKELQAAYALGFQLAKAQLKADSIWLNP